MRKKQVCPCLNLRTAPTRSCVFVCVVLSKKKKNKKNRSHHYNYLPGYSTHILPYAYVRIQLLPVRRYRSMGTIILLKLTA